jgi:hypothetical protein
LYWNYRDWCTLPHHTSGTVSSRTDKKEEKRKKEHKVKCVRKA